MFSLNSYSNNKQKTASIHRQFLYSLFFTKFSYAHEQNAHLLRETFYIGYLPSKNNLTKKACEIGLDEKISSLVS